MSTTVVPHGVLFLTSDSELVGKLRRKLEEYLKRNEHVAPEVAPLEAYKTRLLSALLERGSIDFDGVEAEFRSMPWYSPGKYAEAVKIISSYNVGDVSRLRHGTGLK